LHGDFVPALLVDLLGDIGGTRPAALGIGAIALLLLFLCERWRRLPGSLLAIALGIAGSDWLARHGVALVGAMRLAPQWAWPSWPSSGQWCPAWSWRRRWC